MAQPTIQTAFASGEWAPKLRSRVDIQKYRLGASLLRNFFVDWAGGGASTRNGTKFMGQVGANGARLIRFQPSATVTYVLEMGNGYIRFFSNGAQIMSGGIPYQIASPFLQADLFPNASTSNPGIKFVQDVNSMIICHPNYPPQILTIISPTNWTINAINFGTSIGTPTGLSLVSNLGAGTFNYAYTVTAVDINGQESIAAIPATVSSLLSINTNNGSNSLSWSAVQGAQSYNVYKATPTVTVAIPVGAQYGFIANVTGTSFIDTTPGILPDFTQTPPIGENPFFGAPVASITVTASGAPLTSVPTVTLGAPPTGGLQATATASLGVTSVSLINHAGIGFDLLLIAGSPSPVGSNLILPNGVILTVATATLTSPASPDDGWVINTVTIASPGSVTSGTPPTLTVVPTGCNAPGFPGHTGGFQGGFNFNLAWGVTQVFVIQGGAYLTAPSVTFAPAGPTATAVLGTTLGSNPGVPGFFQERLVFAGLQKNVQGFDFSQPNSFFNFNTSFPVEDDDAINGSIIAEDLNAIRSLVNVPTGLVAMTNKAGWLLNGGAGISTANPLTPTNISAQTQGYNGASDILPIKINQDILYVTYKGQYVRDLTYNVWSQLFTGTDITPISTHLFQNTSLVDWCWCEEPLKTVWVVRSDGVMLSLAYVKEQELIGWAHHDTNGQVKTCCAVTETIANGETVDAVYVIVERFINGATVQYVERFADRYFQYGYEDSWSVDCALQTAPSSSPTGLLRITGDASAVGNTVTLTDTADAPFTSGMATNHFIVRAGGGIYQITAFTSTSIVTAVVQRIPTQLNPYTNSAYNVVGFQIWTPVTSVSGLTQLKNTAVTGVADGTVISGTVSNTGTMALGGTFTKVTLGLAYTPQLQTLPLDLGEPTVQSKRKKEVAFTIRVADTLGLQIGTTFANVVAMKDFQLGAVPTTSTGVVSVTDLVNGDGRTILDQTWQEFGIVSVQQNLPYPATILGIMPEVAVGDTPERERGRE